jgi:hypothetical protein
MLTEEQLKITQYKNKEHSNINMKLDGVVDFRFS